MPQSKSQPKPKIVAQQETGGACNPRLVRPDAAGWWDWYQGQSLDDDPEDGEGAGCERLLICDGGTHVVDDDEYEQVTGENPDKDGWHANFWEGTETTQKEMPGLWVRANV